MDAIRRRTMVLEGAFARWWLRLDTARALTASALLLPVLFGLLSLAFGHDDNWDLHNYHYYNPYALLNGKVGYDLAPGQWQSYFNPTLDLVYYGLNHALPPPLAGFVMGWLHGLNALLVLAVARLVLPAGAHRMGAALLALAGCMGPGFLSQVGNTMGDNMASLCVLGALLLLLRAWPRLLEGGAAGLRGAALAGLVMGLGAGLKLTNATYALALCLALLAVPAAWSLRLRLALAFGLGTLAGIALSAGHWYWRMWQVFGNPLFPQFNNLFQAPLAAPIGIGDTGWLPRGWLEKVLWPFIFTVNPRRVTEIPITPLIWPLLYLAAGALLLALLLRRGRPPAAPLTPRAGFLLLFMALAYTGWLNLFGVYRYLVPLELLAPLALWLILARLLAGAWARRAGVGLLVLAGLVGLPHGGWSHARWGGQGFAAAAPAFAAPAQSMVLTVIGEAPMSWVVPFFPREVAFVSLGSGFPESPAYVARMAAMMAARSGPFYVMLPAYPAQPGHTPAQAEQARQRAAAVLAQAQAVLARYRMAFEPASCVLYPASIGTRQWPYQLCRVGRPAAPQ